MRTPWIAALVIAACNGGGTTDIDGGGGGDGDGGGGGDGAPAIDAAPTGGCGTTQPTGLQNGTINVAGNAMLALVHPDGWKPFIVDWEDLAGHLVERLHRELAASPRDAQLAELLARVLAQPGVPAHWHKAQLAASVRPFAAVHLRRGALELRMFTMLTTLGTPLDVTAEELRIETYFPADEATESVLRSWAS